MHVDMPTTEHHIFGNFHTFSYSVYQALLHVGEGLGMRLGCIAIEPSIVALFS